MLCYVQTYEHLSAVAGEIEKAFYHTHRQSLSKSARTGKQSHAVVRFFRKLTYKLALIKEIAVFVYQTVKVFAANANLFLHVQSVLSSVFQLYTVYHKTVGISSR